jgi:hypothetical protein
LVCIQVFVTTMLQQTTLNFKDFRNTARCTVLRFRSPAEARPQCAEWTSAVSQCKIRL